MRSSYVYNRPFLALFHLYTTFKQALAFMLVILRLSIIKVSLTNHTTDL